MKRVWKFIYFFKLQTLYLDKVLLSPMLHYKTAK